MAPRRCESERKAVLEMHKRGSSYGQISALLGVPRSTCSDIVRRFGERGSVKDKFHLVDLEFLMSAMIVIL